MQSYHRVKIIESCSLVICEPHGCKLSGTFEIFSTVKPKVPRLPVAGGQLGRVLWLDDFAIVRASGGRSCAAMIDSCSSCGAIEVEDVNGAFIRSCADPCRVAVEGNTVDLSSIDTSAELVEQLARSSIKDSDQRALIRGRGAFGSVRVGDQTKEWAGMGWYDRDVGCGLGAGHGVFRLRLLLLLLLLMLRCRSEGIGGCRERRWRR